MTLESRGEPCSSIARGIEETVKANEGTTPTWRLHPGDQSPQAVSGAHVVASSPAANVTLCGSGSQQTRKGPPLSRSLCALKPLGSLRAVPRQCPVVCLEEQIIDESEQEEDLCSEGQPEDPALDTLLPGCVIGTPPRTSTPEVLLHRDMSAPPQTALPSFLSLSSSSTSASSEPSDLSGRARSSQGQQAPSPPKLQHQLKSQTKMSCPPENSGGCRRPRPGGQERSLVGPQCPQATRHQAGGTSHPAPGRQAEELQRSKPSPVLPHRGRAPAENSFGNKIKQFLQKVFLDKDKETRQEKPLQKGPAARAPALGPQQVTDMWPTDKEVAKAYALTTAIDQILETKLSICKASSHREELQVCGGAHSSSSEQRRQPGASRMGHGGQQAWAVLSTVLDTVSYREGSYLAHRSNFVMLSLLGERTYPDNRSPHLTSEGGEFIFKGTDLLQRFLICQCCGLSLTLFIKQVCLEHSFFFGYPSNVSKGGHCIFSGVTGTSLCCMAGKLKLNSWTLNQRQIQRRHQWILLVQCWAPGHLFYQED
ncbi:Protein FAM75A6 [Tupaia chinensis]|uniref:Protein FAM75A6 n=1 Tax=Tupaia chinensis TaxID=246437 RepID=L9LEF5_TUPCH|nr:Protein FAM75A6 [Tupaia chinensis]